MEASSLRKPGWVGGHPGCVICRALSPPSGHKGEERCSGPAAGVASDWRVLLLWGWGSPASSSRVA